MGSALADALGYAPAIVQGDRTTTCADEDTASALAGTLERSGVGAGHSVGVYLHNSPDFLAAYFAAWKLRARPVNVNYRYVSDELAYLLTDSQSTALVFGARLANRVAPLEVEGLRSMGAGGRRPRSAPRGRNRLEGHSAG